MNQTEVVNSNDQTHRKVLVIVGPSGVGKGTLIGKIRSEYPDKFAFKISHTTRNKREGEEHGKHYYFISKEEFENVSSLIMIL
jgi:guanylate kinase